MDFARFLSLLFTENCMVTRANATSDELSVLYMTSPSAQHTCVAQSRGLGSLRCVCCWPSYKKHSIDAYFYVSLKLYNTPLPCLQTFMCKENYSVTTFSFSYRSLFLYPCFL